MLTAGFRWRHVRCHPVRHDARVGAVLGPRRNRVAQVLVEHTLEGGHLARLVQAAEQVVERPVLEHHHNDVVQRVLGSERHRASFRRTASTGRLVRDTSTRIAPKG
jgi:hypothetical protein